MRIYILSALVLAGCAQAPQKPTVEQKAPVDERCAQLSSYARATANLREIGVQKTELIQFSTGMKLMSFPIRSVHDDVYASRDQTPEQIETRYAGMCQTSGYDNVLAELKIVESKRLAEEAAEREVAARQTPKVEAQVAPKPEPKPAPKKVVTAPKKTERAVVVVKPQTLQLDTTVPEVKVEPKPVAKPPAPKTPAPEPKPSFLKKILTF